jgi:hypothetical protein
LTTITSAQSTLMQTISLGPAGTSSMLATVTQAVLAGYLLRALR